MSEFLLGMAFGGLVVGAIATPFLTIFGIVFFNVRRMEKHLSKEVEKPTALIKVDEDVAKTVEEAERLIAKTNQK